MISSFTHICESPYRTYCGCAIPPIEQPVMHGSRVGLIVGDHCHAAYIVGVHDSNDSCQECESLFQQSPNEAGISGIVVKEGK